MNAPVELRRRADIPAEYRWDFTPIYPDWDAWERGLADLEAKMHAFAARQGTMSQGPQAVLDAYHAFDDIGRLQYLVYCYPQLQRDVDMADQQIAAQYQRVSAVFARFDAATAWFTPELLTIPEPTMRGWIDATPELAPYRFPILDQYRRQQHVLDAAGERLLALAGPLDRAPGRVYQELSTTDIVFPTITLTDGTSVKLTPGAYHALLEKATRQDDRAAAADAYLGNYGKTVHTYAAIYEGVLQRDWYLAQARRFGSTLEAALHADAIPTAVVETLIQATRAGTEPLRRYLRLRKRMLGLDAYHLYDGFVPLAHSDKTYPYETACELTLAALAPLGEDYLARYRRFVAGGRIDVYESEGKRSGAYSAGVYGVGPYQLLNHNDTLDAVFTFAHEGGHAMHTVLSHEHQPFATSEYTIFVAEVASTINERFLLAHMSARETDPTERFLLLQHAVDQIVGTFYTQVLFADFELQAHRLVERGEPVTTEVLGSLYLDLLRDWYGDAVEIDDFYQWTWARIPHFFGSPYYVYQYATCFASSAQLFRAMTTGEEAARRDATARYLALLASGGNDHPMAQLQKAGIDLTRPETVQAVIDEMDALVARMEDEAARLR